MSQSLSYPPADLCIYCGATENLTLEHIIPFSLGGTVKLPRASCRDCARITGAFEGRLARTMYGNFRIRADFPTRRRNQRPVTIRGVDVDTGRDILLSPEESVVVMPMVHFLPPGILREPPVEPPDWVGATFEAKEILPVRPIDLPALGCREIAFNQTFDAESLGLTLAKIAHAYAAAEYGVASFEPFLPEIILGKRSGLFTYVGGDPERLDDPDQLHTVRLRLGHPSYGPRADYLLMVSIALMSRFGGPTALVVVGRADEAWAREETARRRPALAASAPRR